MSATGDSTARAHPPPPPSTPSPSLLSFSPSVLEPALVQSGLGKAGFPPLHVTGSHLDGGRRRQRFRETDRGSENEGKEKEILIASRGIPSLSPAACDPGKQWATL